MTRVFLPADVIEDREGFLKVQIDTGFGNPEINVLKSHSTTEEAIGILVAAIEEARHELASLHCLQVSDNEGKSLWSIDTIKTGNALDAALNAAGIIIKKL